MKKTKYHINGSNKNIRSVKSAVTEVTTRVPLRLWIIFIALFLSNIYIAISSAGYGTNLVRMEKEMKAVSEENKILMEQMVARQSLQNVSVKAEELGLLKPSDVIYLDAPSTLTSAF